MTTSPWYYRSEDEIRKLCADVNYRTQVEKRLAELRAVNTHGIRCVMSKQLEDKLSKILATI